MRLEYFQLIDRIVDLNLDDQTIRVDAVVPTASPVFEGHFPGHPLMPGVLLIESMAQTSGWLIIARTAFTRMPFLAAVRSAKLRRFVSPGERLVISAKLIHEGSGYAISGASISVSDKPVADAEITFRIMEFPSAAFRDQMKEAATRLSFPMGVLANG
jgi:3-hydroxyacyl-[acyl-carrier-protein] dehydratase